MKSLLAQIGLVIECRDYRTPLVSRNPLFEQVLGGRPRLIVYTKRDLATNGASTSAVDRAREEIIRSWDAPLSSIFVDVKERQAMQGILNFVKEHSASANHLVCSRLLVVGMPNVGKSSLLNSLRRVGIGGRVKKAARTGGQPGITRKIGTSVKITKTRKEIEETKSRHARAAFGSDGGELTYRENTPETATIPGTNIIATTNEETEGEAIYLLDTPGVFVPYVPDAESMLKLALCNNVKENLIPPTTTADYLLYHINLHNPALYATIYPSGPTNDIHSILDNLARKAGRLKKGGEPDLDAAATLFIQRWRAGLMGKFVLDHISDDAFERRKGMLDGLGRSLNQARKMSKEEKRGRLAERSRKIIDR